MGGIKEEGAETPSSYLSLDLNLQNDYFFILGIILPILLLVTIFIILRV